MGRQVIIGALLWLTFNGTLAVNLVFKDNVSAQSVRNMFRWPTGMYASAAPYGAYSVPVPFIAPKPAASSVVPVKETLVYNNPKGYLKQSGIYNLKDSYGNRYVQSPQSLPLKPSFPQQFLKLQELPAHLVQPLAAAPLNYNNYNNHNNYNGYKQGSVSPQVVYGSHYKLPLQSTAATGHKHISYSQTHPVSQNAYAQNNNFANLYADTIRNFGQPSLIKSQLSSGLLQIPPGYSAGLTLQPNPPEEQEQHNSLQQSSSSEETFSSTPAPRIEYHHVTRKPQYEPIIHDSEELYDEEKRQAVRTVKQKLKKYPVRETQVNTVVNGQKTIVNLRTKPTVPLLDISLLEPLTFKNPLVPQVQHFLPRINQATYHKLSELELDEDNKHLKDYGSNKPKSHHTGQSGHNGKPKKHGPKRKHKRPSIKVHTTYGDEITQASTARPTIVSNESPEIVYEISSPNYKETIKEKTVSYNKQTNSDPIHYSYGSNTHKEPVKYSYTHSSKEPIQIKEVRYESHGEGPKTVDHGSKSEHEQHKDDDDDSGESDESYEESDEDDPPPKHHYHKEHSKHTQPEHREEHHHESKPNQRQEEHHHESQPKQREEEYHHRLVTPPHHNGEHKLVSSGPPPTNYYQHQTVYPAQYEDEVRIAAPLKVNPSQHIQPVSVEPRQPTPQFKPIPAPHQQSPQTHQHSSPVVHEKTKQVIRVIKEETPEDNPPEDSPPEKELTEKEEDSEKDFETAYKNAAYGFPAFHSKSSDSEQDVFNPDNYGVPRDHVSYNTNKSPFQQYQAEGDPYPKTTRLSYMDDRDKTKEDYFLGYSVNKPESLTDHYKKQVDYYKMIKQENPQKYVIKDNDENKKTTFKGMFSALPYSYYPTFNQMSSQMLGQYKTVPFVQEFDYSKGDKRDNSGLASRPFPTFKMNTHFVEPQFQYGFEPAALPRLLDSELASMATNDSPQTDKSGLRKKVYTENFYIKTTNTDDRGPSSR